jgi:hypothetical protein
MMTPLWIHINTQALAEKQWHLAYYAETQVFMLKLYQYLGTLMLEGISIYRGTNIPKLW